jgi:cytochrome c553
MGIYSGFRFLIKSMLFAVMLESTLLCVAQVSGQSALADATLVKACTVCHGPEGRSTPYGYFPRLAGKPETYLYNQLLNFQQGTRHYQQMSNLLGNVNPAYLQKLAHFFATQAIAYPPPAKFSGNKEQLEVGLQLARNGVADRKIPACTQCHGDKLNGGVSDSVPGLLGLTRDYLIGQLGAWRTNQRHAREPDCMAVIAKNLSVNEISAVTAWLSSQPGPKDGHTTSPKTNVNPRSLSESCGSVQSNSSKSHTGFEQKTKPLTMLQSKGQYLSRIGNCVACHTTQGGEPMAGGKAIEPPFGIIYSTNLTPDNATGIGTWSADDFWNAIHEGRSKDGSLLSPAFPYTELTQVTRADSDAIFAYLQTLPAQKVSATPNALSWPSNTQLGIRVWRALYFKPGEYKEDLKQSKSWNRGAYLVNGLSHCGSCHTPRNKLGASELGTFLGGSNLMANGRWYAPSLLATSEGGVQDWSTSQIGNLLQNGITNHGYVSGPMAEFVYKGTQYLTLDDSQAIATYLQSLQVLNPINIPKLNDTAFDTLTHKNGKAIYDKHCENCHGKEGDGAPNNFPSLVGNRNVLSPHIINMVQSVLLGAIPPTTASNPSPAGMPPFRAVLSDIEVAQVLTYIRHEWGNQASSISTLDVLQITGKRN